MLNNSFSWSWQWIFWNYLLCCLLCIAPDSTTWHKRISTKGYSVSCHFSWFKDYKLNRYSWFWNISVWRFTCKVNWNIRSVIFRSDLYYSKAYGHQTWLGDDLLWEVSTHEITQPFVYVVRWLIKNIFALSQCLWPPNLAGWLHRMKSFLP